MRWNRNPTYYAVRFPHRPCKTSASKDLRKGNTRGKQTELTTPNNENARIIFHKAGTRANERPAVTVTNDNDETLSNSRQTEIAPGRVVSDLSSSSSWNIATKAEEILVWKLAASVVKTERTARAKWIGTENILKRWHATLSDRDRATDRHRRPPRVLALTGVELEWCGGGGDEREVVAAKIQIEA